MKVDCPVEMVADGVAVADVEFPCSADPSVKMDLEFAKWGFMNVVLIKSVESMMRLELKFPKRGEANK